MDGKMGFTFQKPTQQQQSKHIGSPELTGAVSGTSIVIRFILEAQAV